MQNKVKRGPKNALLYNKYLNETAARNLLNSVNNINDNKQINNKNLEEEQKIHEEPDKEKVEEEKTNKEVQLSFILIYLQ